MTKNKTPIKKKSSIKPIEIDWTFSDDIEDAYLEAIEGIRIEIHDLDNEVARQAVLFQNVAEGLAIWTSIKDERKADLAGVSSRVYLAYKDEAAASGNKVTEAELGHRVVVDSEVVKARKRYEEAQAKAHEWTNLREAWIQRSHMLGNLVRLRASSEYMPTTRTVAGNPKGSS